MKSHTIRAWYNWNRKPEQVFAFDDDGLTYCPAVGSKERQGDYDIQYRITITRVRRERGRKK